MILSIRGIIILLLITIITIFTIITLLILYFTFFLENYLYIKHDFLDKDDISELSNILNNSINSINSINSNNIFLENNTKKYILFDKQSNHKIYNIIYNNPKLKRLIKDQFNVDLKYPTYDIEYRIYKTNPSSMGWHQDHKIINKKYLECIYVIENTTNSPFRWFKNLKFHNYLQKTNDLIMLKPHDLIHNIDPILYGNKRILKFIIDLE